MYFAPAGKGISLIFKGFIQSRFSNHTTRIGHRVFFLFPRFSDHKEHLVGRWTSGQVDSDFGPVAESSRPLIQYDHRRTPHDQRRCPVGDDPYRQAPISILHDSFRIIVEDGFSQDTLRCVLEVMRNA